MARKKKKIMLILNDLRSVYNTGAIFRTAEATGVTKIYLAGTTPCPKDRFGRSRKDFNKVALGSEKLVPWEYIKDVKVLLQILKKEEKHILALEQHKNSIPYNRLSLKGDIVIIVGNEVTGMKDDILALASTIIEIPMYGKKESLNVSVAAGILLYALI